MKRVSSLLTAAALVVGCTPDVTIETTPTSTTRPVASTPTLQDTSGSTTTTSSTPTSTTPWPPGGELVKLDMETLEPVEGLDPIPVSRNSRALTSADGKSMVVFDWADVTVIDVQRWAPAGTLQAPRHSARVLEGDRLYMYDDVDGRLTAMDLTTGEVSTLGEWSPGLEMWDGLRVLDDGRIAALGERADENQPEFSVYVIDPPTGETMALPVGPIRRINWDTGVVEGDYEYPETDTPGLVWGEDRLFIVHADDLEVAAVDLGAGEVEVHSLGATSWWDRLLAFWMPTAAAKGPFMGTNSSAALSPDGRYLFISGVRYDVSTAEDGGVVEENQHLGLTVVDTESWEIVARPDLPFQFVRNAGEVILGTNTQSISPWVDHLYVLSIDDAGDLSYGEPVTVENGGCRPSLGTMLICTEHTGSTQQLRLMDPVTAEVVEGPRIGPEDALEANGVLVDRRPVTSLAGS